MLVEQLNVGFEHVLGVPRPNATGKARREANTTLGVKIAMINDRSRYNTCHSRKVSLEEGHGIFVDSR